jgi:hypothetical protein
VIICECATWRTISDPNFPVCSDVPPYADIAGWILILAEPKGQTKSKVFRESTERQPGPLEQENAQKSREEDAMEVVHEMRKVR